MKHGVRKLKKLGRPKGARMALYRSLITSFLERGEIETTVSKAKGMRPQVEKLVTIAKKGGLSSYRRLIAKTGGRSDLAKKLIQIALGLSEVSGGYVSIQRTRIRSGDAAQLAKISWSKKPIVEEKKTEPEVKKIEEKKEESTKKVVAPIKEVKKKETKKKEKIVKKKVVKKKEVKK